MIFSGNFFQLASSKNFQFNEGKWFVGAFLEKKLCNFPAPFSRRSFKNKKKIVFEIFQKWYAHQNDRLDDLWSTSVVDKCPPVVDQVFSISNSESVWKTTLKRVKYANFIRNYRFFLKNCSLAPPGGKFNYTPKQ